MITTIIVGYLIVGVYFDAMMLYVAYQRGYYSELKGLLHWDFFNCIAAGLLAWPAIVKEYIEADF